MQLNQVYNQNCLEGLISLDDESVDLILTDPPYGIDYQSNRSRDFFDNLRFNPIANDKDLLWFPSFIKQCERVLKKDSHCYLFCTWKTYHTFVVGLADVPDLCLKGVVVWDKMTHGSGDLQAGLAPSHEWILFLTKGRRLWDGKRPNDIIHCSGVPKSRMVHPNQKPITLLRGLVQQSSNIGDLVLDPFSGSGSTLLAAMWDKRNFLGFELDEDYHKKSLHLIERGKFLISNSQENAITLLDAE